MPQPETGHLAFVSRGSDPSGQVLRKIEDDPSPEGLILADGRIATATHRLLEGLGFAPTDDLRGLRFTSFWHHRERAAAAEALRRAREGEETRVRLDLGYIRGRGNQRTLVLSSAGPGDMVLMTLI